ncbi:MAG TPA: hypothetical protein VGG75_14400 [Trebonia sp.]
MPHCYDCGETIVEDADSGSWVHEASPAAFNPAQCVLGTSDGRAYGISESVAAPCADNNCPDPAGPPWWAEFVR